MSEDYKKLYDDDDFVEIKRHRYGLWSQLAIGIMLLLAFNLFLGLFLSGIGASLPFFALIGNAIIITYIALVYWKWKEVRYLAREKQIIIIGHHEMITLNVVGTKFIIRQGFWQKRFGYGSVEMVDLGMEDTFYLNYVIDPYGAVKSVRDMADKETPSDTDSPATK